MKQSMYRGFMHHAGARRVLGLGLFASLLLGSVTAHAGRTHFGWLYGTDVVPERGTEFETWIVEENKKGDDKIDETSFWWGLVFALTPHLELAITTEAAFEKSRVEEGNVHFTRWGGELRYRPQSPDSIDFGRQIQPIFAKRCFACRSKGSTRNGSGS